MALLTSVDTLLIGEPYTFTYDSGKLFQSDSDDYILGWLRHYLKEFGDVQSVDRGLFSGRFVITVIPKEYHYLSSWLGGFKYAWDYMQYDKAIFISAEGGTVSSAPGGASQVATETLQAIPKAVSAVTGTVGEAVGGGLTALIKPLAPYLIIGVGVLLYLEYRKHAK